jgi:hypothetical protein
LGIKGDIEIITKISPHQTRHETIAEIEKRSVAGKQGGETRKEKYDKQH